MNSGTQVLNPITEDVAAPVRGATNTFYRLAAFSAAGAFTTLSYASIKFAYYWPIVQATIIG